MAKSKKKKKRVLVKLKNKGTGTLYYTYKSTKLEGKLTLRKYDKATRSHVEFVETSK